MNFHERFRELLNEYKEKHSDVTQAQIASTIGLTPQAFSYYLNGREPNYDTLIKLSNFFNVTVDYMIGKSDYKNTAQKINAQSLGISDKAAFFMSHLQDIDTSLSEEGVESKYNIANTLNILLTSDYGHQFFSNINSFFDVKKCNEINDAIYSACINDGLSISIGEDIDAKYIYLNSIQNSLESVRYELEKKIPPQTNPTRRRSIKSTP